MTDLDLGVFDRDCVCGRCLRSENGDGVVNCIMHVMIVITAHGKQE